jgi:hypothetical protein
VFAIESDEKRPPRGQDRDGLGGYILQHNHEERSNNMKSTARSTKAEANHEPLPGQPVLPEDEGATNLPAHPAAESTATGGAPVVNPFDPARIRIGTNYGDLVGTQAANLTFPVWARPPKASWFRVHPTNEVDILMLDLTETDSDALYYLDRSLYSQLILEPTVGIRLLVQCQTRQGTDFLWAIKLKGPFDKRENSWTTSALKERTLGRTKWIRHRSNREKQGYDPKVAVGIDAEPEWPTMSFEEILELALKDRYITSLDHEVLVALLKGE